MGGGDKTFRLSGEKYVKKDGGIEWKDAILGKMVPFRLEVNICGPPTREAARA